MAPPVTNKPPKAANTQRSIRSNGNRVNKASTRRSSLSPTRKNLNKKASLSVESLNETTLSLSRTNLISSGSRAGAEHTSNDSISSNHDLNDLLDLDDETSSDECAKNDKITRDAIQHFRLSDKDKSTNTFVYQCLKCQTTIRALNDNLCNLRRHLGNMHEMDKFLYESQKKIENTLNLETKLVDDLNDAIVNCVIEDARPFGDFNKPGMIKFLKKAIPGNHPPTRQTIARKLNAKYKAYKSKLKETLCSVSDLALTTDMWKNRHLCHFLGLTVHYFNRNFEYVSLIIGFKKFNGRHLSDRLNRFIDNELNKLDIKPLVRGITSDNGADMKKATSSGFGDRVSCFCHNLNLTLKPIVVTKKQDESISNQSLHEDFDDNESTSGDDYPETESSDESFSEYSSESENELDKSTQIEKQTERLVRDIQNLLNRVRSLVKTFRKGVISYYVSRRIKSVFNKNMFSYVLDFHVRWNSTYLMLKRFKDLKSLTNDLTTNPNQIDGITNSQINKLQSLHLSNADWCLIDILLNVLSRFYEATKLLSARKYATLSISFVVKKMLSNYLSTTTEDSIPENLLKKFLFAKLNYHLNEKISASQKRITLIAAYLDPLTNVFLDDDEKELVEREIAKLFSSRQNKQTTFTQELNTETKLNGLDSLAMLCGGSFRNQSNTQKMFSIREELAYFVTSIEKYNATVENSASFFSDYWRANCSVLPKLASLVRKYCIIPASSVAVESAFSEGNFIQRKERSSLSSKRLRY